MPREATPPDEQLIPDNRPVPHAEANVNVTTPPAPPDTGILSGLGQYKSIVAMGFADNFNTEQNRRTAELVATFNYNSGKLVDLITELKSAKHEGRAVPQSAIPKAGPMP